MEVVIDRKYVKKWVIGIAIGGVLFIVSSWLTRDSRAQGSLQSIRYGFVGAIAFSAALAGFLTVCLAFAALIELSTGVPIMKQRGELFPEYEVAPTLVKRTPYITTKKTAFYGCLILAQLFAACVCGFSVYRLADALIP